MLPSMEDTLLVELSLQKSTTRTCLMRMIYQDERNVLRLSEFTRLMRTYTNICYHEKVELEVCI